MDIVLVTSVVATLFVVIGLSEPLAAKVRLPFSVILAVLGSLIGAGALFFLQTDLTDALNPVAEAILGFPIKSNVFLYLFLPTLLFQATLGMNLRRMLDDWVPILVMAVVAVLVATLAVGYALSAVSVLPLAACLLLGAIVSTTDPSAVVGIFRSIAAPQRLSRIIEGESLLNDAAAVALFGLFMSFVMVGVPDPTLQDALKDFPLLLLGGAITGWFIARLGIWLMAMFEGYELAQISISVALPYLAYIGAEQTVGASGVIAVVAAGLTLNLAAPGRLTPQAWSRLEETWDVLAYWAGALIFILAAILIPRFLSDLRLGDLALLGVVTVAAFAARAVILFGLLPLLSFLRVSPVIERPYRVAMLWGGLRGAVTLALALAVTESARVPEEVQRIVGILATGFTLFTLLVQGPTLRTIIRRLGLDRLSPLDEALSKQVVAVALQTVREDLARNNENYDLNPEIVRAEAVQFGSRLENAVQRAEHAQDILDRDRITLGLLSVAGAERDIILGHMRDRSLSTRLAEDALVDIDRLIEATRLDGRTGYMRAAQRTVTFGWQFRAAAILNDWFGTQRPIALMTAHRFEILLAQRLVLRDICDFIDQRIRRIHGRRVADILRDLVDRRIEIVETALEGLKLQYPGYVEELQKRFIRRTALRLEEREYNAMLDDGLISPEPHSVLMQGIAAARVEAERRPKLDVAIRGRELVQKLSLFGDLDQKSLRQLTRALKTRYADAGETIIQKEDTARSVFFIASGAVELRLGGQSWRLGRGEIFGQAALLSRKRHRLTVKAIVPTALLVLNEASFRRLIKRSPVFRDAVQVSAQARGVDLSSFLDPMETGAGARDRS
ncbi:cation:proton antiporter [Roseobacter sinensis]|uniref:Cation:proton antiporter n=1 Tax=Roseobacter sinensis TaxID=2931391 RepID=A0ABT3BLV1_9RHOB|nr:cation:proton antiporter [Roseobacter sp. WL0113]MCV3274283.1 cation:proton antiporter [Roseobacter sp. WL0113]